MQPHTACVPSFGMPRQIAGILTAFSFGLGTIVLVVLVFTGGKSSGPHADHMNAKRAPPIHVSVDNKDYDIDANTASFSLVALFCVCVLLALCSVAGYRVFESSERPHLS